MANDVTIRWGVSGPLALLKAVRRRAKKLGKTVSGHIHDLLREDLEKAGEKVPPPLQRAKKRIGTKPHRKVLREARRGNVRAGTPTAGGHKVAGKGRR